jgi:hypothetical protein
VYIYIYISNLKTEFIHVHNTVEKVLGVKIKLMFNYYIFWISDSLIGTMTRIRAGRSGLIPGRCKRPFYIPTCPH